MGLRNDCEVPTAVLDGVLPLMFRRKSMVNRIPQFYLAGLYTRSSEAEDQLAWLQSMDGVAGGWVIQMDHQTYAVLYVSTVQHFTDHTAAEWDKRTRDPES
jgi:hypothetical protein